MKKLLLFIVFFIVSLTIYQLPCHALPRKLAANSLNQEVIKLLSESKCFLSATELIKDWYVSKEWIKRPIDFDGGNTYVSPTDKTGTWVEISFYPNKTIEMMRISHDAQLVISWKSENCEPIVRTVKLDSSATPKKESLFTDNDLDQLLSKKDVLIYAWSPHMPISYEGFAIAKNVAKKNDLAFLPLLDPEANEKAVEKAAQKYKLPKESLKRIQSIELVYRGMLLHFPTILLIRNGKFSSLYPGLPLNEQVLDEFVKEFQK